MEYINHAIKDALQAENDDALFYCFKHDGAIDFNRKLAAGVILHERGYALDALVHEKNLIINDTQQEIEQYSNASLLAKKNRKQLSKKIWGALGYGSAFVVLELKDLLWGDGDVNWIMLSVIVGMVALFIGYRLYRTPQLLAKLMQTDAENLELLNFRMNALRHAWKF